MSKIIGGTTATPMKFPTANQEIQAINSLKYYGDANVVPSDADLFLFDTDDSTMTAQVSARDTGISGDIVIPYECVVDDRVYKVISVASRGFSNCVGINRIVIPYGIGHIPGFAFLGCTNIYGVIIPKSVTRISVGGFQNCTSLTDVYYGGTKKEWDKISISDNENEYLTNSTIHYEYTDVTKEYVDELKRNIIEYGDMEFDIVPIHPNYEGYYGVISNKVNIVNIGGFLTGGIMSLCFSTPEVIPEDYTYIDEIIKFKGDSVEDERFVPKASTRYTIVFAHDGANIIGYVGGVSI